MAAGGGAGTLTVPWDGVTGSQPAGSVLQIQVNEYSSAGCEITGSFTGTVTLEGTFNGTVWFAANCLNVDKSSATNMMTAAGQRRLVQTAGLTALRARANPLSVGSIGVQFTQSLAPV